MAEANWTDIGAAEELGARQLSRVRVGAKEVAVTFRDGVFGVLSNACNHVGGPLGEGRLEGDFVACPWHGWRYDVTTGANEIVPDLPTQKYEVKVDGDDVLVDV